MTDTSTADIIQEKWNQTMRQRIQAPQRKFSWHSDAIQKFIESNYTDGKSILGLLAAHIGDKPLRKALDIGGGHGETARDFQKRLNVGRFDVVDISDVAVASGQDRAKRDGRNMRFFQRDLNHEDFPDQGYDLIIASGSLHHIENLEHLFKQVASCLAPNGVFFARDYMGPNHMQWVPKQLALMNALIAALPDEMNRVSHKQDRVMRQITRIPLEIFAEFDPSEGVRAEDIMTEMSKQLEIERIIPIGQTLIYETLRGRIHNFQDDDPKDRAILTLMCLLENELIKAGIINSDFNLVFARKRSTAA